MKQQLVFWRRFRGERAPQYRRLRHQGKPVDWTPEEAHASTYTLGYVKKLSAEYTRRTPEGLESWGWYEKG